MNSVSRIILSSEPNTPAIHWSFVVSHNNEPDAVFGEVSSLTTKPAFVAPVPFNWIMLSPMLMVVESICVVVPFTSKSPLTVKLEPVTSTAPFIDDVNVFKLLVVDSIDETLINFFLWT